MKKLRVILDIIFGDAYWVVVRRKDHTRWRYIHECTVKDAEIIIKDAGETIMETMQGEANLESVKSIINK